MKNTFQFLTPIIHKVVTCNTSDQIYLARDKFDRKLPCCKNNSTELFIVLTYLTKYMTCEKSDWIPHTYISPKMFPFIKNLFTGVQAIEMLMCNKLVWVENSKSAKRILHLCPNVKNSVEFITPAWGIRSVRNTVQHNSIEYVEKKVQEKSRVCHNHTTMKLSTKELLVEFVAQSIAMAIAENKSQNNCQFLLCGDFNSRTSSKIKLNLLHRISP